MMGNFRGGSTPYIYHGEEISLNEAAKIAGITPEGLKYRLKKYGGNMDMAIDGKMAGKSREDAACDEILDVLGIEFPESEPADNTTPENQAAPELIKEPTKLSDGWAAQEWKTKLRIINRAIEAMEDLAGVELGGTVLNNTISDAAYELRGRRCEMFEEYVDWEGLAR